MGIKKYMSGLIDKAKEISPYHKIGRALRDAIPKNKDDDIPARVPKRITPAKKRKKIKPKKK